MRFRSWMLLSVVVITPLFWVFLLTGHSHAVRQQTGLIGRPQQVPEYYEPAMDEDITYEAAPMFKTAEFAAGAGTVARNRGDRQGGMAPVPFAPNNFFGDNDDGEIDIKQHGTDDTEDDRPVERVIIRNMEMNLMVADRRHTAAKVEQTVKEFGGWVFSSNFASYGSELVLKISAEHLLDVAEKVRGMAVSVEYERLWSDDVTEEFVDIKSRLRNLENTYSRLDALMQRATNVEEVLMVQRELTSITAQLEVLKGRRQYITSRAQYSTLRLRLNDLDKEQPLPWFFENIWQPIETLKNALRAVLIGLATLADFLIFLSVLSIPLVPLCACFYCYFGTIQRLTFRIRDTVQNSFTQTIDDRDA